MIIKFKDGHEIEFKKCGNIWLAESVIFERLRMRRSIEGLHKLKNEVTEWFEECAPTEIREKYNVRLPLWKDIEALPFKDQIAYAEGKTNRMAEYLLGDENDPFPAYCFAGRSGFHCGLFLCRSKDYWGNGRAIRLCLEEKK